MGKYEQNDVVTWGDDDIAAFLSHPEKPISKVEVGVKKLIWENPKISPEKEVRT